MRRDIGKGKRQNYPRGKMRAPSFCLVNLCLSLLGPRPRFRCMAGCPSPPLLFHPHVVWPCAHDAAAAANARRPERLRTQAVSGRVFRRGRGCAHPIALSNCYLCILSASVFVCDCTGVSNRVARKVLGNPRFGVCVWCALFARVCGRCLGL